MHALISSKNLSWPLRQGKPCHVCAFLLLGTEVFSDSQYLFSITKHCCTLYVCERFFMRVTQNMVELKLTQDEKGCKDTSQNNTHIALLIHICWFRIIVE